MHKVLAAAIVVVGGAVIAGGQQAAPRTVQLTLHEGTNMAAAVSPDGRALAIDLLGTDIFLDARQPSWSPADHGPDDVLEVVAAQVLIENGFVAGREKRCPRP
jgi:hypothetical protein